LGAVARERGNVVEGPRLRKKPETGHTPGASRAARLTARRAVGTSLRVPPSSRPPTTAEPLRLILASGSPRRSEILGEAGVNFQVDVSGIDEKTRAGETPGALVVRLAREKCLDVAGRRGDAPARPVLAADTIVVAPGDEVLGKPRDEAHAIELVSRLIGVTHRVMTGVAVAWTDGRGPWTTVVTSQVEMREATRDEVAEYVTVGESLDKAGAYALQGEGARFVTAVRGSRTNVIGLPLEESLALLDESGAPFEALRR